jgi:hypothetical protein
VLWDCLTFTFTVITIIILRKPAIMTHSLCL